MDEAVLVDADIDEGSKGGYVGDDAGEFHAQGVRSHLRKGHNLAMARLIPCQMRPPALVGKALGGGSFFVELVGLADSTLGREGGFCLSDAPDGVSVMVGDLSAS